MRPLDLPIPCGWYYVAEAAALKRGDLQSLRRFGHDLMLWRGISGEAVLQGAYCPHLGAHIGIGGDVVGDTVRCPFHHWSFDASGMVADIPYANRQQSRACIRTMPVCERYGNIFAWYHPGGLPPTFPLPTVPALDGGDYIGPRSRTHVVKAHIQEMVENSVDGAHFMSVHNHPGPAEYEAVTFDGPIMNVRTTQLYPGSKGPVQGTLETINHGFGFGIVHYRTLIEVCMLAMTVPIDRKLSDMVFQLYYRNPERSARIDRIAETFNTEVNRQLTDDIPIWENKVYVPRPVLCDGDGPIIAYRRWASQFYEPA